MKDQERGEHQQAHRAAVEGGMLPSYGDDQERADALDLAQRVIEAKADGALYSGEALILAAALLATNEEALALRNLGIVQSENLASALSEVAQLKAELEQVRAENEELMETASSLSGQAQEAGSYKMLLDAVEENLRRLTEAAQDATLDRVVAKVTDALEQAWSAGQRNHPAPHISRTFGYLIAEIKNVFHAAVKREVAAALSEAPATEGSAENG